jgi:hypothetical protein
MMNLFIWLGIVNFLAFFISKSKYTKPFRKKLGSLSDTNINKLKPTYIVLYQLVKCSFCLAFWGGIFILSWTAEPVKTLFGIDFFLNFVLDGIFSFLLNIIILIIYGLIKKIYKFIKNKKNG